MAETSITLYTTKTPNGVKISMLLEELGLQYKVVPISFDKNEQKEPWFLKINPNGRIPALTDTFSDGQTINLFESSAIMQYLVDRYDKDHKLSYPPGSREHYSVLCWLAFLNAGVGPMQGQANHFFRYAPEKIQYGINRYQNETRRLYRVIDTHLKDTGSQYLVGDKVTIADIAHIGWLQSSGWAGVERNGFPSLCAWLDRLKERPAIQKGNQVPQTNEKPMSEEEQAKQASNWIMKGMQQDAEKL